MKDTICNTGQSRSIGGKSKLEIKNETHIVHCYERLKSCSGLSSESDSLMPDTGILLPFPVMVSLSDESCPGRSLFNSCPGRLVVLGMGWSQLATSVK